MLTLRGLMPGVKGLAAILTILSILLALPVSAVVAHPVAPGPSSMPTTIQAATADTWPMFRGNAEHTGVAGSVITLPLQFQWSFLTGGNVFSSPAVDGDRVFFGSNDGKLYAAQSSTGSKLWEFDTGGAVYSSPAVVENRVFFGARLGPYAGKMYALDAATGSKLWEFDAGAPVQTSPVVTGGEVRFGAGATLYTLDAATGSKLGEGHFEGVVFSPAVGGGRVLFGSSDWKLHGGNWEFLTGGTVASSPAVAGGRVFFGSNDHKVYGLDINTGVKLWEFVTGGEVDSSPAVAGDTVFIGSFDGKVYALDAVTGAKRWEFVTGEGVSSSAAVSGNIVLIGSNDKKLYGLDAATGAKLFEFETGDFITSSVAVAGQRVFFTLGKKLYALGTMAYVPTLPAGPAPTAGDWLMFRRNVEHTGNTGSTVTPPLYLQWTYQIGGPVYSSPAVAGGRVFFGSVDKKVYALDAATGARIWEFLTGGVVGSSPAVVGDTVFVGSWDGKVYALDAATGAKLWEFVTGGELHSSPAVSGGTVFIGSYDGKMYALDAATGNKLWDFAAGSRVYSSPAVAGGKVFFGSGLRLYALDAATGNKLWEFQTVWDEVLSSPTVVVDRVFFGAGDKNVYALEAATGKEVWEFRTGAAVVSSPAMANGWVFIGSTDMKLYALASTTEFKRWEFAAGGHVSSPSVSGNTVFFGSRDNSKLYALDTTSGAKLWEFQLGGGVESSPALVANGLFVGSNDGKVYAFGGTPVPVLAYTPTSLDFGTRIQDYIGSMSFDIWNSGTGTLSYDLSETSAWMTVNPLSGSSTGEHDTITVSIDTSALSFGSHSGNVSLTSDGGSGTVTVSVNVVAQPAQTVWSIQRLGSTGWDTSIAIDNAGRPHIAYHDIGNGTAIKQSWWDGNAWQTETVGTARGNLPSLAVDATGNPRIAYISTQTLQYAYKDTSGWHFQNLDPGNSNSPSMALDGSGRPYIVYIDLNYELKYARWDGSAWVYGFVDQTRYLIYPSLSFDGAGNPRVSYHGGGLSYGYWDGSAWQTQTVDSSTTVSGPSPLALDALGNPYIAFLDKGIAKCAYKDSSGWHTDIVDSSGHVTGVASIAFDSAQRAHVFFTTDAAGDNLKHAVKTGSTWWQETVQGSGQAQYVSAMIDKSANPNVIHVSYYNPPGYLQYARSSVSDILPPSVLTTGSSNVTLSSAQLNGNLTSLGSASSANVSFQWGTSPGNYSSETPPSTMTTAGNFSANLNGLLAQTPYYFRAKATSVYGIVFGDEVRLFTNLPSDTPSVRTDNASGVTSGSATLNGTVLSMGTYTSLQVYFEFGTTSSYGTITSYNQFVSQAGPFSFTVNYPSVLPNTLYHYRAVIVGVGTGQKVFGQDTTFTTLPASPTVITNSVSISGNSTATLFGNLTYLGSATSANVSFEVGTSTQYGSSYPAGTMSAPGLYSVVVSGLSPGVKYHFRAKAEAGNSGTAYGNDLAVVTGVLAPLGKIAFTSEREGAYESKVYVMAADGRGQTKLTGPLVVNNVAARDYAPSSSPDGTRIAFYSSRDMHAQIYVTDLAGNLTRLTSDNYGNAWPAWSPDGSKIAFVSNRDGGWEIYTMNANGSNQARLTNNSVENINPRWLPDGTLAWDSGGQTYLMNADGTNQRPFAGPSGKWSPDGSKIVFTQNGDIYVANGDGSNQTQLTSGPAQELGPTWSPDGQYIAFATDRDGGNDYGYTRAYDIYVMKADGSNQMRVTTDGAADTSPSWTTGAWPVPVTYTLTITSGGNGNVAKNPDQASYGAGTIVRISATPVVGYHFAGWTGDTGAVADPSSANTTVTVNGNYTLQAHFAPDVGGGGGGGGGDSGGDVGGSSGGGGGGGGQDASSGGAPPAVRGNLPSGAGISEGATSTDSSGHARQLNGDSVVIRMEGEILKVVLPVLLNQGESLRSFRDSASGVTFSDNVLTIPVKDLFGRPAFTLMAKTETPGGTGLDSRGRVLSLEMETAEVKGDLSASNPRAGSVASSMVVELKNLPAGAWVEVSMSGKPDAGAQSAFELAVSGQGGKLTGVAYLFVVNKSGLENQKDLGVAIVTMKVGRAWVEEQGGTGNVRILHRSDSGEVEVLATTFVGYNDQGQAVFMAISPKGLSSFALAGVQPVAPPASLTPSPSPSPAPSPSPSPTVTASPSTTPSPTPAPSTTPAPTPASTTSPAPSPVVTPTITPTPAATVTASPTTTPSPAPTATLPATSTITATSVPATPPAATPAPPSRGFSVPVWVIVVVLAFVVMNSVAVLLLYRRRR